MIKAIFRRSLQVFVAVSLFLGLSTSPLYAAADADIIFVTQVPTPQDFANVVAVFGNQKATIEDAPRGGDLWIRYKDGTLKNLTQAAGYGTDGFQGAGSIAVRDPAVHWDGTKVLFSMVIGGATRQYDYRSYRWQLYEITGLGKNETPVVTKVPNQPEGYNNVMGTYGTADQIIFSTDRPRGGEAHLYPQRDEYESTATNSGLWSLVPSTGELKILDHAPSGAFNPIIDSFGRVIYTRWDHLQRDQQADGTTEYGAFNFSDEGSGASKDAVASERFPEPRSEAQRVDANLNLHSFNHFFPWEINEDGTGHETLNHIGRQELHSYIPASFNNDDNLEDFYDPSRRFNKTSAENFLEIREDPNTPGKFYGINGPEFRTHASGQIVSLLGQPSLSADKMPLSWVTHPDTSSTSSSPSANHSGFYRNPLPLKSGELIAAHTTTTEEERNIGTSGAPRSLYDFRLKSLTSNGSYFVPSATLTSGITKTVWYWSPDSRIDFTGNLWEIQPVELIARTRPTARQASLETPEQNVFSEAGVDPAQLKTYLRERNLALIVSRDVLTRDKDDKQQPFNLKLLNVPLTKAPLSGKLYEVALLQLFQGNLIRGYGGVSDPQEGRRVIAQISNTESMGNIPASDEIEGSIRIAPDGSLAAFVPAQRALTWQMVNSAGEGVVRERYWLTFQPGEIRVCASCHGVNSKDQRNNIAPVNEPQALADLLEYWKTNKIPTPIPTEVPTATPNPDGTPRPKKLSVSVKTVVNKSKSVPGILMGSKIGEVEVKGLEEGEAYQVKLSVSGKCSQTIREFTAGESGKMTFRSKVPSFGKKTKMRLTISDSSDGSASTKFEYVPDRSKKRRNGVNLCGILSLSAKSK